MIAEEQVTTETERSNCAYAATAGEIRELEGHASWIEFLQKVRLVPAAPVPEENVVGLISAQELLFIYYFVVI